MLGWLYDFLMSIWDTIISLLSFVDGIIKGLLQLIVMLPTIISVSTSSLGYLPAILAAFASVTIAISIVYLIVGRNTGDS